MHRQRSRWALLIITLLITTAVVGWIHKETLLVQARWIVKPSPKGLTEHQERALAPGTSFMECASGCPEMVVVPAGSFVMGSPDGLGTSVERPARSVAVSSFAASRYHVTFDEWDACVLAKWCRSTGDSGWGRGRRPVINVSWHDAQRHVEWLSNQTSRTYRLLTEAEWEYAARGQTSPSSTPTNYFWGESIGVDNANCSDCGSQWDKKQTAPADYFKANAFGLHDMLGNAWDWVEDRWHPNYEGAPIDGSAWEDGTSAFRILRGGAWHDPASSLRLAVRRMAVPNGFDNGIGIRVARTLLPSNARASTGPANMLAPN